MPAAVSTTRALSSSARVPNCNTIC
jgi:hypothetical protein